MDGKKTAAISFRRNIQQKSDCVAKVYTNNIVIAARIYIFFLYSRAPPTFRVDHRVRWIHRK
jgi:hypothetical protein